MCGFTRSAHIFLVISSHNLYTFSHKWCLLSQSLCRHSHKAAVSGSLWVTSSHRRPTLISSTLLSALLAIQALHVLRLHMNHGNAVFWSLRVTQHHSVHQYNTEKYHLCVFCVSEALWLYRVCVTQSRFTQYRKKFFLSLIQLSDIRIQAHWLTVVDQNGRESLSSKCW